MLRAHYLRPEPRRVLGVALRENSSLLAVLLLWAMAMVFLGSQNRPSNLAPGSWIGVRAIEGGLFYTWFDDEAACLLSMTDESLACVSSSKFASERSTRLRWTQSG
jgi:hypothetical protein